MWLFWTDSCMDTSPMAWGQTEFVLEHITLRQSVVGSRGQSESAHA